MGKRSPPGTPASWHVEKDGDKFRLFWDEEPCETAPLFDSVAAAEAWMTQWYADHPPEEFHE